MKPGMAQCPAKVNTFLSVGPPGVSGYHPIRTVFQAVSLFDELSVAPADVDILVCDGMRLPERNTLTKTLALVRELVPVPSLSIRLEKRIPAESGLGGGSSDAAGLLRLLSNAMPGMLTDQFCHEVATAVGADAPFFLVGGRAIGEGLGERLTPLPDAGRREMVVIKPREGTATAEAYRALDAVERTWRELDAEATYNDFERVAGCASLEAIERLRSNGADSAMLTGSGSAVFGFYPTANDADVAARRLAEENIGAVLRCHTLTREESLWTS